MPANIDMTPTGATTPIVRFYADSIKRLERGQEQNAARQGAVNQGPPVVESVSLDPGELRIEGHWLGTDARALAERLRDSFLDDETVTKVDIAGEGTATTTYDGTYALSDRSDVDEQPGANERIWRYDVVLTEV